jgi:hypothetical protein
MRPMIRSGSRQGRRFALLAALIALAAPGLAHAAAPLNLISPTPLQAADWAAFTPNDRYLALANPLAQVLTVYPIEQQADGVPIVGAPVSSYPTPIVPMMVTYDPIGDLLALASESASGQSGSLELYRVGPGGTLTLADTVPGSFAAVSFSNDGRILAATTEAGNVAMYGVDDSTATLSLLTTLDTGSAYQATFDPAGPVLIVATDPDSFFSLSVASYRVDTATGAATLVTGPLNEGLDSEIGDQGVIALSPDGRELVSEASRGAQPFTVDPELGTLTPTTLISTPVGPLWDAYAIADGLLIDDDAGNPSQSLALYGVDTATATTLGSRGSLSPPGITEPESVNVSPDGTLMAVSQADEYAGGATDVYALTGGPVPEATILAPADGITVAEGATVPTSFTCSDGAAGTGVVSCRDSLGDPAPAGRLDTSLPGPHLYTVTVTAADGQSSTTSIDYTVQAPPAATISAPASGEIFALGQAVPTAFSCSEGTSGPGLASCSDSSGDSGGSGTLNTSAPGRYTYTVTATSRDGQTEAATITYTVAAPPSVTISSPVNGAQLHEGQAVPFLYTCAEGGFGPGLRSCGGAVADGAPLSTALPGLHTVAVTATSTDGQSTTTTVTYSVRAAPHAPVITRIDVTREGRVTVWLTVPNAGRLSLALRTSRGRVLAGMHRKLIRPGRLRLTLQARHRFTGGVLTLSLAGPDGTGTAKVQGLRTDEDLAP